MIFRLVQECLTNVHRHSGSSTAAIKVELEVPNVIVRVQDWGKGVPLNGQLEATSGKVGVGLGGMQERIKQIGGSLQIQSDATGTAVIATIPYVPMIVNAEKAEQVTS